MQLIKPRESKIVIVSSIMLTSMFELQMDTELANWGNHNAKCKINVFCWELAEGIKLSLMGLVIKSKLASLFGKLGMGLMMRGN